VYERFARRVEPANGPRSVTLLRVRRFLGATGRVLITLGILLLLFVAYQLWGTGIYEAQAQNRLKDQFHQQLQQRTPSTTTTTADPSVTTTLPSTTVPPVEAPPNGDALGRIDIPKIGLSAYVVEGVDVGDLRKGPGHYPGTPLPGQLGNSAIAGHRTTYGAPFGDLDQLAAGDEITVQTVQGTFKYTIDVDPFAVSPDDGDVLLPKEGAATLTLTTCNPKYSAAERLIIKATLELPKGATPLPPSPGTKTAPRKISGLSGERSSRSPAILWGIIVAFIGLLWWWLFHRYPRWTTWFVGVIPFLAALFVCYTYVERLLPSNY
jgi:sortase A